MWQPLFLGLGIFCMALGGLPAANESTSPPSEENSWFSRYELGAGDVLNITMYGRPELERRGLRVAPDGTLSYLQANSIPVRGLTIDETRGKLETELSVYYRNIRLIVTPSEVGSKTYTMLGQIVDKGIFPLDRPITVLEALARSRGVSTGIFEKSTIELADMRRSFIIRDGERLSVDLEKLYYEGDISQNIFIEPNDYIYIASNIINEFYVLGEVGRPGVQGMTPDITVVQALSRREGFTQKAWREKVLLVRGSLENPEAIAVNVKKILQGKEPDILIEPKDIIFVSVKPWNKVEQILDVAIDSFIESFTSVWILDTVPNLVNP